MRSIKGKRPLPGAYFGTMMRRRRTFTAFLTAFALVFAQFAVSAHACVRHEQPAQVEAAAHHECCAEDADANGKPFPGNGNACAAHCQYGDASFDKAQFPVADAEGAGPVLRLERSAMTAGAGTPPVSWPVPAAAPPPPAILFGVLRI